MLPASSRRAELERLGFDILSDDEHTLLAQRHRWHLDLMSKIGIMVWVQSVDHLTLDRLRDDQATLRGHFKAHDPQPSWPVGLQRARVLLPVYLAEAADPDALAKAAATPSPEFAAFLFPVVITPDDAVWHEQTPLMGAIFYPLLRWLAGRMARPDDGTPEEPESAAGKALVAFNVALLAVAVVILLVSIVSLVAVLAMSVMSVLLAVVIAIIG